MEQWLVMLVAIAIVCFVFPPALGFFMGMGVMVGATYVVYKLLGG